MDLEELENLKNMSQIRLLKNELWVKPTGKEHNN